MTAEQPHPQQEKQLWDKSFDWGDLKTGFNFFCWMLVAFALGLLASMVMHP